MYPLASGLWKWTMGDDPRDGPADYRKIKPRVEANVKPVEPDTLSQMQRRLIRHGGAIAGTQRPWRELVFPMKLGTLTIQMNLMILNSDDS